MCFKFNIHFLSDGLVRVRAPGALGAAVGALGAAVGAAVGSLLPGGAPRPALGRRGHGTEGRCGRGMSPNVAECRDRERQAAPAERGGARAAAEPEGGGAARTAPVAAIPDFLSVLWCHFLAKGIPSREWLSGGKSACPGRFAVPVPAGRAGGGSQGWGRGGDRALLGLGDPGGFPSLRDPVL